MLESNRINSFPTIVRYVAKILSNFFFIFFSFKPNIWIKLFENFVKNIDNPVFLTQFCIYLYINLARPSVCLFVSNKRQNGWTDRAQFFCGTSRDHREVYEWSKFQIFVSIKIRSSLNFWKFWKSTKFFVKICELFLFCFTMYTKRTCSQLI